jgi:PD-(D/E)XK endonuclease
MTINGAGIKCPKERGEWAELRFMARAAEHGLRVSKPWGDSSRYDFAVESGGRFLRVQVKSTTYKKRRSYVCHFDSKKPYTKQQIDFLAAYIVLEDVWYILPIGLRLRPKCNLILSPHLEKSKYGRYKEAWHLLLGR